ncbi:hypothetical protein Hs30E_15820 [Lactococcus hodotermopsidis]|uniref:Uncharacterized protein n=1 Tax=Pseudolactococcus hodotermopsidis TaxID=2709157 RepID=A0A6A0BFH2_9LACT|nr:hypothetical protein Hs30E_15820 [Lactococcus hodotermopsidis]
MDLRVTLSNDECHVVFRDITRLLKQYDKLCDSERSQIDCALECVQRNEETAYYIITKRFLSGRNKKSYNQLAFELYYDESNVRKIRNAGYKWFAESYKGGVLLDRCLNKKCEA